MEIKTSIIINASPQQVWQVFADFDSYPQWNPFIRYVKGEVAVGKVITINADGMKFKPTVLKFSAPHDLQWLGRLWLPGIFDGKHEFKLVDNGNGTTTFHHNESFKGLLVPLFKKKLLSQTKLGFEAMNEKLKHRVEQGQNQH